MEARTILLAIPMLAAVAAARDDDVVPARSTPDPVYFEDVVLPMLDTTCGTSGCHGAAGAGRLILERPDFLGTRSREVAERNLATVLPFVTFGAPMESRLVLKPLHRRDGGLPHSGKTYDFRKGSEQYRLLDEWIRGVELADVAPIADAGDDVRAKVGERVTLDGARSRDRRDRDLAWSWSLRSRPEESAPRLKGADTATPTFEADRIGAYQLALVVTNGALESAPSTVTVEVDDQPFVLLAAEGAPEPVGFYVVSDAAATGGRALATSQEAATREAVARYPITLPEAGPYHVHARVDVRETDRTALRFSFDDGPEHVLATTPTGGYRFVSIDGGATDTRLDAAGGDVAEGSACVRAGRLELTGTPSLPARLTYGDRRGGGSVRGTVTFGEPRPGGLHAARALVVFDWRDRENHRFAGFELGRSRAVIGRVRGGEREVLAERRVPLRPGHATLLDVGFRDDRAFLLLGEGELLEARLDGPVGFGEVGLVSTCPVLIDDVRLVGDGVDARTFEFSIDGQPAGWLAAGEHVLVVRADGDAAPRLDEILISRADFDAQVDDASRRAVRTIYLDLLGRTPTAVELTTAAGMDREQLVRRLVGSLEFYEAWYENELYYFLLLDNFRPKTPEMDALPARLSNGQTTARDALQQIVISQAFNARNPGNDTFVSVVLEQLLGLVVQDDVRTLEAGKKMYDGHEVALFGVKGKSQSDLVGIVLAHEEFTKLVLSRHYARVFPAPPPKGAIDAWAARLRDEPRAYEEIVIEWLTSDAYRQAIATLRPKSDAMWIRSLYVDLFERKPTFQEFRNFRNALQALADSAPLRSVLAKVMLDSGQVAVPPEAGLDVRTYVEEQFRRFLGRAPNPQELAAFEAALKEPACSPATLVHAIVSSAEYQHY